MEEMLVVFTLNGRIKLLHILFTAILYFITPVYPEVFKIDLIAQGNSRMYNPESDQWLAKDDPDNSPIFQTTFIREKVEYLLEPDTISKVRIGITKILRAHYYYMEALSANNNPSRIIIGDFPCPEDCVPPDTLKEKEFSPTSGDNLFDVLDINNALDQFDDTNTDNPITYLVVRRAKRIDISPFMLTHVLFALTGQRKPDNSGTSPHLNENAFTSIKGIH